MTPRRLQTLILLTWGVGFTLAYFLALAATYFAVTQ